MKPWIDAQLSPAIARWITANYEEVEASATYDLGYLEAEDAVIYMEKIVGFRLGYSMALWS